MMEIDLKFISFLQSIHIIKQKACLVLRKFLFKPSLILLTAFGIRDLGRPYL